MKKGKGTGTGNRACACVSIAFVALLFFSVATLSIAPVFANVQIDEANGTWSDSFDGANPEEGIAASTNITVADGDVKLSKTALDWMQTTQADFEAGVLNNVNTSTSSGDVKLELVPNLTLITSDNTDVEVKGTTPTPVKTLTFTKSGDSYNELRIDSNLKVQTGSKIAYCDIKVDGASKFTHETNSENYVPYSDTLDFSSYADGEYTITLYLYTDSNGHHAYNSIFVLYRTKTYVSSSSGTIASQVLDTGAAGANWTELNWGETLEVDTDITFEVRALDTSFAKDAETPSWTDLGTANSPVTSDLPSRRYVQWRAAFSTSDDTKTPTLHDVTVSYSYFNTPANLTSIAITPTTLGGWSTFYANTTSPAGTGITFSILNATTNSTLISGISAADAENGYDISSISSANASIRLYALLNTSNASNTAELHDWNVSWIEPPTNLTITSDGVFMNLSWNGTADGEYDIYVTDDFAAGFSTTPHATVTGLSWVDTDAANHVERYYRVGAKGSGAEVGAGTVGKFDVATTNTWTLVSLPFIPEDTDLNEVIGDQLTGGLTADESDRMWMWTGTTYEMWWLYDSGGDWPDYDGKWFTTGGSPMIMEPGKGYWIQIREGHSAFTWNYPKPY